MCFFVYNVYKGVYSVNNGPGGVQKTVQFSVPDSLRLLGHDHFCKYVYFYIMYIRVYIVYIRVQEAYRRRYSSLYLIHYASWVTTT